MTPCIDGLLTGRTSASGEHHSSSSDASPQIVAAHYRRLVADVIFPSAAFADLHVQLGIIDIHSLSTRLRPRLKIINADRHVVTAQGVASGVRPDEYISNQRSAPTAGTVDSGHL